jgi:hypothetical protein
LECPVCRGLATVTAHWSFRARVDEQHATQSNRSHRNGLSAAASPARSTRSRDSSADRPNIPTLPWWPSDSMNPEVAASASATPATTSPAPVYHSMTQLPDHMSILVDPGAWTNLAGSDWVRRLATLAVEAGHTPSQEKLRRALNVQGVGQGGQSAVWQITLPVAIADEERTLLHEFTAPVVNGGLPALLGLRSMQAKNAVLEMTPGQECLTFPGPSGYTITWSPGTRRLPLRVAPSGHLVLPCDLFGQVEQAQGGLAPTRVVLRSQVEMPPAAVPTPGRSHAHDAPGAFVFDNGASSSSRL